MKKFLFIVCLLAMAINASAQTNTYETIRDKGIENLRKGNFADAKSRFNLLEPFVTELNRTEYNSLLSQLHDSINNLYQKANALRKKKQYQRAIVEYQRLIGRGKEPLIKPLYAHIGYCYEMLSNSELAGSNYQTGMQYNESLSSLRMAWYIRRNKISITSEEMIGLYMRARNYYEAMDSLGVEYARLGQINESYKWYRKSQRSFSKYNMAVYLLDPNAYGQLLKEYQADNPIKLLSEATDEGYAPAQYYLGLLYYYAKDGERVKQDKKKGMDLMKKASSSYVPAKLMIRKINYGY